MLARIGIRIIAVRNQHHPDIETLLEDKVNASERGMDSGRVAVIHDSDIVRKLLYQPDLRNGQ